MKPVGLYDVNYDPDDCLGHGTYGIVYKAVCRDTKSQVRFGALYQTVIYCKNTRI